MAMSGSVPRVLLVEDELLIRDLLQSALEDAGFEVADADSGAAAIDLLQRPSSQFAGVVTDVNLGSGTTGWDVARAARRADLRIAVVYMSGGSAHEWAAEGVPDSAILAKPFAPAQLVVALATQLNNVGSIAGEP
jgi:two-component system, cell cycle response regulator CpdR